MVLALPTAAAEQPLAEAVEAVAVQQLGPPAVRAVAAAVAQEVRRVPEAWVAQPKAAGVARAEQDAAAVPQPGAASDAEVPLPEAAEVPLPEAAAVPDVAAEALRRGAAAEQVWVGAVLLRGAAPVAEVQPRAVRDEQGVRPSAAAWAAALSTPLRADRLAPSLPALSAHARARLRIAQP
jgi:hypothetical protein